jgi:glycogen phosphorylase
MSGVETPGRSDLDRAAAALAAELPTALQPLAQLAYNFRWTWMPHARDLFASIDPSLFERVGENPVRLLLETRRPRLEEAAADPAFVSRAATAARTLDAERDEPGEQASGPVAFLCAEFGIHRSLHIYSGGLGVLAGDILREASDRRLPVVAIGILYADGNFHQRIGAGGHQEDYWAPLVSERLPAALVTGTDGEPVTVDVPIDGRSIRVRIWRVDVGRIPLYLLDAGLPGNDPLDRWVTARLYVGDRSTRLAQYALLGAGGVRALDALGIDPAVLHLNEGHAAFAPLELARRLAQDGVDPEEATERARARTVFTTHTPVPAGNEAYPVEQVIDTLGPAFTSWQDELVRLGSGPAPGDPGPRDPKGEESGGPDIGMTTLALRLARSATAVSELHGRVSRHIWRPLFDVATDEEVPIGSVTNGVHVPTWLGDPMRALLDRTMDPGWLDRLDDPATWEAIDTVTDEELWTVRRESRRELVDWLRDRAVREALDRTESRHAGGLAANALVGDRLTIGFARRVATYKRLPLLYRDLERTASLLGDPDAVQLVIAGKAHPRDLEAKETLAAFFGLPWRDEAIGARMTFVEDYDMSIASRLVAGCDVWLNVPRPPWEASGTSGMKAAMNGAINVSVLDGWWAEGFDGTNGFAIGSAASVDGSDADRDERDAIALYETLEQGVVPAFYDRDADGIPPRWLAMMRASLKTIGPRFSATRMLREYMRSVYPAG